MEDENGRKRIEKHLSVRPARAELADLHGLGQREKCKCVLNGAYKTGLRKGCGN